MNMKMFAPNVLVIGDTIYDIGKPGGRPNPAPAATKYETEVMTLRQQIVEFPFGQAWLNIVGNNPQPIIIVPTTETNNAAAETFENIAEHPDREADAMNGKGTPSRVKFNTSASLGFQTGGVQGAVLLVHEMTHAYRAARGRVTVAPMAGLVNAESLQRNSELARRFPDWEEWFAIVVENVFASETGLKILRTNWDVQLPSFSTDPYYFKFWGISTIGTRNDSQQFAFDYRPAIARIHQLEPALFSAMKASNGWFNPVRDYVAELLSSRH
ncbi:MAG: hypothetical protein FJ267_00385 [Planctomycetes bacterium]|nr:hypothetical protein [Planctomycetota bacterium]